MKDKIVEAVDTYTKGGITKKKLIVACAGLLLVAVLVCCIVGCGDGKCDECGNTAVDGAVELAETQGIKLKGEYCTACVTKMVTEAALSKALGN